MTARSLAVPLARAWRGAGTEVVFGVPGGGANLDVVGAAEEEGLRFLLAHDETAAAIAAGAYGLLTGSVGAAVVTRGPGVTAAATGLAQATLDRSPLVLVSDAVPARAAPRVAHQRLDQVAATRPLSTWSGTLGTDDPGAVSRAAVALARRGPGGVHLQLDPTAGGDRPPVLDPDPQLDGPALARALDRALDRARGARRPVVLVGPAGADAPGLAELAARVPVLCTYQAKGAVPDELSAGLFTGGVLEAPLLAAADLVLAVGVDTVEPIPAAWSHDAPVVMLHPAPTDGRWFGAPEIVVGPLGRTLPALVDVLDPRWEPGAATEHRRRTLAALEPTAPGSPRTMSSGRWRSTRRPRPR